MNEKRPAAARYAADKIDPVRELAMQVLTEVHVDGAYANVALVRAMRAAKLPDRDRRFLTELVYGTVKAGDTLDYILAKYLRDGNARIKPQIRELLRLGIYQIFFMDKVPASAACNTAVELAKKHGKRGADSFVNAVLRTAVREPERAAIPAGRNARLLALREQHPFWMVNRWVRLYGYDRAEELCRCNNGSAPLSLRVNTLRIDREGLLKKLAAAGAQARPSATVPDGIVVTSHGTLDALAPLREGLCQVQDESSMLVAHVLGAAPGMTVIDACAAPGGKSGHLLEWADCKLTAIDIDPARLQQVRDNLNRLGLSAELHAADARQWASCYDGLLFDAVLADVPCTASGVARRHPDIKWLRRPADGGKTARQQETMLDNLWSVLKPGGRMLLATCSLFHEENDSQLQRFLRRHPDAACTESLTLLPKHTQDGFYYALIRKQP